jgi:succinate-semialdehyde dehydrogenase/glutarate-semialdehyde dehydrogenase
VAIASVNPATGETVRGFTPHGADDVDAAVARAADAFRRWRDRPVAERAAVVRRAGALLAAERDALGRLMTLEMGKPLGAAVEEASKCAAGCAYYADHAESLLRPELLHEADGERVELHHQPLGPVLAVMPWNFPFWQVFRFAAPALVAGNVGLLKHASNVPQCALAIEDLLRRAGAPAGVFQTLLVGAEMVERIVADPRVAAATLTGSEPAGARWPRRRARSSSPPSSSSAERPVRRDAERRARRHRARRRHGPHDQQRPVVHRRQAFRRARRRLRPVHRGARRGDAALRVGDPLDPATDVGPLATPGIVDDLAGQVDASVGRGRAAPLRGHRPGGAGNYYPPTVLADVPPHAPAHHEELFGPVAVVYRARDEADAVRIANDTPFGLGASVWTTDAAEGDRLARGIEAGMVFVNAIVASDPRFPFGGIKHSGYGRELGAAGMRAFMNAKTVRLRTRPADAPQPRSE